MADKTELNRRGVVDVHVALLTAYESWLSSLLTPDY